MGFISLLLTIGQGPISQICVSRSVADTWHPCDKQHEAQKYGANLNSTTKTGARRLFSLMFPDSDTPRRSLAAKKYDKCAERVLIYIHMFCLLYI